MKSNSVAWYASKQPIYKNPFEPIEGMEMEEDTIHYDPQTGKYYDKVRGIEISEKEAAMCMGGKVKGYANAGYVTPQYPNATNQGTPIQTTGGSGYASAFSGTNSNIGFNPNGSGYYSSNKSSTSPTTSPKNPQNRNQLTGNQKITALNLAGQGLNSINPQDTDMKYGSNDYFDKRNKQMSQGQGLANTIGAIPIVGAFKSVGEGAQNALAPKDAYGVSDSSDLAIAAGGFFNPLESTTSAVNDIKNGKFTGQTAANLLAPGVGAVLNNKENKKERDKLMADAKRLEQEGINNQKYNVFNSRADEAIAARNAGIVDYNDGYSEETNPQANAFSQGFGKSLAGATAPISKFYDSSVADKGKMLLKGLMGKKDGGEIKGAGTGKSDSITMQAKEGDFIVPVENAHVAKGLRKHVLGKTLSVAPRKTGDVTIKVSNGEELFTKEEADELKAAGIDLDALAPHAESALHFKKGGELSPEKAALILKDGIIRNKKITDAQRKYFGYIASKK